MTVTLTAANDENRPICWRRTDALEEIRLALPPATGDEIFHLFSLRVEPDAAPIFVAPAMEVAGPEVREFVAMDCYAEPPELELGRTIAAR
jgi:hypothetical protein